LQLAASLLSLPHILKSYYHEKNVSAIEQEKKKQARLSPQNENPWRQGGHQPQKGKKKEEAHCFGREKTEISLKFEV